MIEQYNRQCDTIKAQTIQVDKLNTKLKEIESQTKTPQSIVSLEKELKKVTEELKTAQLEYDNFSAKFESVHMDLQFAKSASNQDGELEAHNTLNKLEEESMIVAGKIETLTSKAANLSNTIQESKLNPSNVIEAQQLQQQLELANSKLEQSKDKANSLKNELNETLSPVKGLSDKFEETNSKIKKLGSKLLSVFSGNNGFKNINNQLDKINKKISQFGKRISGLIASALIFNVLSSALRNLSNGLIGALNSNSQFASSLNQIKVNLLTAFAPIYNYILPAINSLMSALSSVTGQIASFVAGIFGTTATKAKNNAKSIYSQSKAYKDLGKSADKAKGSLSSLDEIENLNDTPDSGTAGTGETGDLDFSGTVQESGKLLEYLNSIKQLISEGDFFGVGEKLANSINNALNTIDVTNFTNKIDKVLQGSVQIFNGFITGLDWTVLGTKFSQLVVGLTGSISKAIKSVKWDELGKGISSFITAIKWGELATNIFDTIWNTLSGIGEMLLSIKWGDIAKTLSNSIHELISHIYQVVANTDWIQLAKDTVNAIISFVTNIDWGQLALDILTALATAMFTSISLIIGVFEGLWDAIVNFFTGDKDGNLGQSIMNGLADGLSSLKDAVITVFRNVWTGIKDVFGGVGSWFKDTFSKAWQAVKNIFSTGGKIFDGIKDGILSGLTAVVNVLISGINKVISIPFNGLNSALQRIKRIEIVGMKPFNWIPTIKTPQIPYLAKGAVIPPNAEFAAVLGDQKHGRNLEAPEDLIRKIVREESGGMNTDLLIELNKNIVELANRPNVFNVDGQEFAQATYQHYKNEEYRQQSSMAIKRS